MPVTDSQRMSTDPWQKQDRTIQDKDFPFDPQFIDKTQWALKCRAFPQGFQPCQCPPAQQQAAGSTVQEQQRDTFQYSGSLSQPTREKPMHPYSSISLADTPVTNGPHPHSNPINRGHPSY